MKDEQLWVLMGRYEYGFGIDPQPVALFTSDRLAFDYIKKAKLKNPTRDKVFRNKSLLSHFEDAWVERYYQDDLPLDPKI